MHYRIHGTGRFSGRQLPDLVVEAATEKHAIDFATPQGMLISTVEEVSPQTDAAHAIRARTPNPHEAQQRPAGPSAPPADKARFLGNPLAPVALVTFLVATLVLGVVSTVSTVSTVSPGSAVNGSLPRGIGFLLGLMAAICVYGDATKLRAQGARTTPVLSALVAFLFSLLVLPLYLILRITTWRRQVSAVQGITPSPLRSGQVAAVIALSVIVVLGTLVTCALIASLWGAFRTF
jgi:hypothetical protein